MSSDQNDGMEEEELDSDIEIAAQDEMDDEEIYTFGQRAIYEKERILERIEDIKANFYNRLKEKKLIKKEGRIPFSEHMTISKSPRHSLTFIYS
jgi:hypothetical protein